MPYIKSHSNYVLKKEHQLTNDGKIYERDITTIGGLDNFSKGQVPIYRSGNFVITVRNEPSIVKDFSDNEWEKNPKGNDSWTLDDVGTSQGNSNNIDIFSNQDYYDLRDFAYYGSCAELIRGSLTDIINRFPGELYAARVDGKGITVYRDAKKGDTDYQNADLVPIYSNGWYLLDNPFGIDIHTTFMNIEDVDNPLKYFCNGGFENYEFITGESESGSIVSWSSKKNDPCSKEDRNVLANITINGNAVKAIKTNDGEIVYLTNSLGWRVRPKKEYQEKFFKSLDSFQRVLLNRDSKPKYSALFQIIRENRFGYYTEMKRFTFPTTYGGYNLAVNDSAYSAYLENLVDVSVLYDENFSDNLYRALTHEAIKNFDWSYTREYPNDNESEYFNAGTRIQKSLRLFGREFDEIKRYIDGIGNSCVLSYSNENNMPNFLLSDVLENDGWDVTSVVPFKKEGKKFRQYSELEIEPYKFDGNKNCYPNGYYAREDCGGGKVDIIPIDGNDSQKYKAVSGVLMTKIQQYFSDKVFSMQDVDNRFMRLLRLNSRHIWRHKGSIEGIEMVLSLFGMKSKRFVDKITYGKRFFEPCADGETKPSNKEYDYEIEEYTAFVNNPIDDTKNGDAKTIDEYNQTKTLVYNTDDYRNGVYNRYQGLPVKYYDTDDGKTILLPFFDKNKIIDGNPHYQMNGGWLWKTKQYNRKDEEVTNSYTETLKNIPSVNNLKSLLSIPYKDLVNGTIYHVDDLVSNYIIIDGVPYDIYNEETDYEYFKATVSNHSLKIGGNLLIEDIKVSSRYNDEEETYNLDELNDGYEIKIYLLGEDKHCFAHETFLQDDGNNLRFDLFYNGKMSTIRGNNATNYFQLIDKNNKNNLSLGWKQLTDEDEEYKKIENIENYFKGNNPHSGNNKYDKGEEYLKYFEQLFKYAIEKKAFDKRCYVGKTIEQIIAEVNPKGFSGITNSVNQSDKIIFFGDRRTENFGLKKSSGIKINGSEKQFKYSEQVVNTKRIKIIFKGSSGEQVKYIDDVVLKYLSEMIPSTAIVEIEYR